LGNCRSQKVGQGGISLERLAACEYVKDVGEETMSKEGTSIQYKINWLLWLLLLDRVDNICFGGGRICLCCSVSNQVIVEFVSSIVLIP